MFFKNLLFLRGFRQSISAPTLFLLMSFRTNGKHFLDFLAQSAGKKRPYDAQEAIS